MERARLGGRQRTVSQDFKDLCRHSQRQNLGFSSREAGPEVRVETEVWRTVPGKEEEEGARSLNLR